MTDFINFTSSFWRLGELSPYSQGQVKQEPMLYSASIPFAIEHGGRITREFIDHLGFLDAGRWSTAIIDSRVHMLMPGWYPCIPGWHLDDVPRTRPDGQPDHLNPKYRAHHAMAVVGDCSLTEFFVGRARLPDLPIGGGVIYGEWNNILNQRIVDDPLRAMKVRERDVIAFDWQSFHRGVPATKNGWRFFIRATINTEREFFNEVRQQVQVYLPAPEAGW